MQLTNFNYNTLQIRTLTDPQGDPWFVAADVCRVLEHSNATLALRYLDKTERANKNLGLLGLANANIISESGLYKLIMRSNKPQAKPFQNWVTQVVLPAIRKDGMYVAGEEKVPTGEMSLEQLTLLTITRLQEKLGRMELENKEMKEELTFLTIDEYRALSHRYFPLGYGIALAKRATKICKSKGVCITKQERTYEDRHGGLHFTTLNVYPKNILEEAEAQLEAEAF